MRDALMRTQCVGAAQRLLQGGWTLCALAAGLASPLFASAMPSEPQPLWSQAGHQVVCQIAWTRVSPTTRAHIAELMERDPDYRDFAPSCAWADDIRSQIRDGVPSVQRLERFTTAHYLNSPPGQPGVDTACAVVRALPSSDLCILAGIREVSDSLVSAADPTVRLESLKFLGHFVGDLHQPLHS